MLTVPLNLSSVPVPNSVREGHSTFEPGLAGNTLQIETFYTSILQTAMDELRPQLGHVVKQMEDSDLSSNQPSTTYSSQQLDVDDTMTRNSDQDN